MTTRKPRHKGAQRVEFALVLPLFLLLVLMVIDFGFITYNQAVITNASREAARSATLLTATPWSVPAIQTVACDYTRDSLISIGNGARAPGCAGAADPSVVVVNPNGNVPPEFGDPITVTVTYNFSGFLNAATAWIDIESWTLTASTTMNHE